MRKKVWAVLLLCFVSVTASAQFPNWGPYAPATTGGGYPANLCTQYMDYVCIIVELCSTLNGGSCTAAGPGGSAQDSGGIGAWQLLMTTSDGNQVNYTTNSRNASQGYIVVIGPSGLRYSFSGVNPGPYLN